MINIFIKLTRKRSSVLAGLCYHILFPGQAIDGEMLPNRDVTNKSGAIHDLECDQA